MKEGFNNLGGSSRWWALPEIASDSGLGWHPDFDQQLIDGLSGVSYFPPLRIIDVATREHRDPASGDVEAWNDAVAVFTRNGTVMPAKREWR